MSVDDRCNVNVGIHYGPYWRDGLSGTRACDRHRRQFEERPDLGPYRWERQA